MTKLRSGLQLRLWITSWDTMSSSQLTMPYSAVPSDVSTATPRLDGSPSVHSYPEIKSWKDLILHEAMPRSSFLKKQPETTALDWQNVSSPTDWISWHPHPESAWALRLLRTDIWVGTTLMEVTALPRQGIQTNTPWKTTKRSWFSRPIPIEPEPRMVSAPQLRHHEGILKACLR